MIGIKIRDKSKETKYGFGLLKHFPLNQTGVRV
ncbi:MAG: hypothetical protein JWP81_5176 [Ferruginibacter sp.]|nr:hypothetical protein [Ferruginibacter sp.]